MPNIERAVDELGVLTGNRANAGLRVRGMRDSGLLDRSARDRNAPQVDSLIATLLLLAVMVGGTVREVAERVRRVFRQPFGGRISFVEQIEKKLGQDNDLAAAIRKIDGVVGLSNNTHFVFGQFCIQMFDLATSSNQAERNALPILAQRAEVSQDTLMCVVYHGLGSSIFAKREEVATVLRLAGSALVNSVGAALVDSVGRAEIAAFQQLGVLVEQSREEAGKRGITVSNEMTWRALGYHPPASPLDKLVDLSEPPDPNPTPQTVRMDVSVAQALRMDAALSKDRDVAGDTGEDKTTPNSEKAAGIAVPTASSCSPLTDQPGGQPTGQPTGHPAVQRDSEQTTEVSGHAQQCSRQRTLRADGHFIEKSRSTRPRNHPHHEEHISEHTDLFAA